MKTWLDLSRPAPQRLAALRAAGANWRDVRGEYRFDKWRRYVAALDQGTQSDGTGIWYTHQGPEFRREKFADEVEAAHIRHTGWYTDADAGETMRGIVAGLPHGRFIGGYYWSGNGERVYFPEVYDDEIEAARGADRQAEIVAEKEREYQERWRAAEDLRDRIERKTIRLQECLVLRKRGVRGGPSYADYVREARQCIAAIRKARDELATNYSDME